MSGLTRHRSQVRLIAAGTAGAVAVLTLAASTGVASADTHVKATYKVTGSTFLKAPNFTMKLGPGQLSSNFDANTGKVSASLTLPNATGSFKQGGVIPVTATTKFINDGKTTGTVNRNTGAVKTSSEITLRIVSLTVSGLPVSVGKTCETTDPVTVALKSLKGFNLIEGGNLAGTYTIGDFQHCRLATLLINATIPSAGNTIALKLGKAKLG
jgi:hypothetical protein